MLYFGGSFSVLFTISKDVFRFWWFPTREPEFCLLGHRDYSYGIVQYSKIAMQVLALTVYSFGPPARRSLFVLRYALLIALLLLNLLFFILMHTSLHLEHTFSMLLPGILDHSFYGGVTGLAFCIRSYSFGLSRTNTIGWRFQCNPQEEPRASSTIMLTKDYKPKE